ncbi:MAG: hypothetical protein IKX48_12510, partial [Victivallales bacterium]|nr:hypothetical protein [Victivallales bacterium]
LVCQDHFKDFDGTILVTFGDMPLFRREIMKALCDYHESHHAACTLLTAENPELMVKAGLRVETFPTDDGDDLRGVNTQEDLRICEQILKRRMGCSPSAPLPRIGCYLSIPSNFPSN